MLAWFHGPETDFGRAVAAGIELGVSSTGQLRAVTAAGAELRRPSTSRSNTPDSPAPELRTSRQRRQRCRMPAERGPRRTGAVRLSPRDESLTTSLMRPSRSATSQPRPQEPINLRHRHAHRTPGSPRRRWIRRTLPKCPPSPAPPTRVRPSWCTGPIQQLGRVPRRLIWDNGPASAAARKTIAQLETQLAVATRRWRRSRPMRTQRAVRSGRGVIAAAGLPVQVACRGPGYGESGFYEQRSRPPSQRAVRHAWLTDLITAATAPCGCTPEELVDSLQPDPTDGQLTTA